MTLQKKDVSSWPFVCVVVTCCSLWLAAAPGQAVRERRLSQLFDAYNAGDDHAVEHALQTRDGLDSLLAIFDMFRGDSVWTRAKSAFLLEIAASASVSPATRLWAVQTGQQLVVAHRKKLGANAADDRFEMLWHHAAIGVLQEMELSRLDIWYLWAVQTDLDEARLRGVTFVTRFALGQAIASADICCRPKNLVRMVEYSDGLERKYPQLTFARAVALFEMAAEDPALRVEALVRGGLLQVEMDHPAEALAWLDRVPDHSDVLIDYGRWIARARALDALKRPAEAAAAYERAHADYPAAQPPVIGLAAALLRAGDSSRAVRVANDARQMPLMVSDPWITFRSADARFVPMWLEEIRGLRK